MQCFSLSNTIMSISSGDKASRIESRQLKLDVGHNIKVNTRNWPILYFLIRNTILTQHELWQLNSFHLINYCSAILIILNWRIVWFKRLNSKTVFQASESKFHFHIQKWCFKNQFWCLKHHNLKTNKGAVGARTG